MQKKGTVKVRREEAQKIDKGPPPETNKETTHTGDTNRRAIKRMAKNQRTAFFANKTGKKGGRGETFPSGTTAEQIAWMYELESITATHQRPRNVPSAAVHFR